MMLPLSWIAFILVLSMVFLGCAIINKGEEMLVEKLDAVILTANDLPTLKEEVRTPSRRIVGHKSGPPAVDGYAQYWDETQSGAYVRVRYWLFGSIADARAAAEWRNFIMLPAYRTESNAANVIGDATWHVPNKALIWFMKSNVLVQISGNPKNRLVLARSVARKIEAKINAALNPL